MRILPVSNDDDDNKNIKHGVRTMAEGLGEKILIDFFNRANLICS